MAKGKINPLEALLHRLENRIITYERAIRKHRDSWLSGDEKCWMDNEKLYELLPEGYYPPIRDTKVELENCRKYIESCHSPNVQYVSPQVRIEELEAENRRLTSELLWSKEVSNIMEKELEQLRKK